MQRHLLNSFFRRLFFWCFLFFFILWLHSPTIVGAFRIILTSVKPFSRLVITNNNPSIILRTKLVSEKLQVGFNIFALGIITARKKLPKTGVFDSKRATAFWTFFINILFNIDCFLILFFNLQLFNKRLIKIL